VANSQPAAAPATPAAGAATPPAAAANYSTNQDENQAYDAAVNMVLKEKNYDKAIFCLRRVHQAVPELQLCSQCPLLARPADVQQG
jgi:TolA-binding protein